MSSRLTPRATVRPELEPRVASRSGEAALMLGEARVATSRAVKLASPVAVEAPVRRIVTIHPSSLAALLATLPALMALRESFPGAVITSYARAPLAEVLRCFASVDEVGVRPGGGPAAQAALMARLHGGSFDAAVCFSRNANALLLLLASGARTRVGFVPSHWEAFLTHRVELLGPLDETAALALTREVGAWARGEDARDWLRLPPESLARADRLSAPLRREGAPLVVLAPPMSRGAKTRQSAHETAWSEAISQASARWPAIVAGTRSWSSKDRGRASISAAAPGVLDLSGRLDPLALCALCARVDIVAGAETNVLAAARLWHKPALHCPDPAAIVETLERALGPG